MANKIDTIERDGRRVHVYDNGLELDAATGRIIRRPDGVSFTPETSRIARRKRQEKTARLLRARITAATNSGLLPPGVPAVRDSAEAFAVGGQVIWEDVVMNADAYPRDRLEAWEKLGKYSEVLPPDLKEQPDASDVLHAAAARANVETARILARVFADVKKAQEEQARQTIDGKVIE